MMENTRANDILKQAPFLVPFTSRAKIFTVSNEICTTSLCFFLLSLGNWHLKNLGWVLWLTDESRVEFSQLMSSPSSLIFFWCKLKVHCCVNDWAEFLENHIFKKKFLTFCQCLWMRKPHLHVKRKSWHLIFLLALLLLSLFSFGPLYPFHKNEWLHSPFINFVLLFSFA